MILRLGFAGAACAEIERPVLRNKKQLSQLDYSKLEVRRAKMVHEGNMRVMSFCHPWMLYGSGNLR